MIITANGYMVAPGISEGFNFGGRIFRFVNGSAINVGSAPHDTLVIFEGPDDSLRQLLEIGNRPLEIWGEPENMVIESRWRFHLENFWPRSLDSHLTELDPMLDEQINQGFGYAYVFCRSNAVVTLADVMLNHVSVRFSALRVTIRHAAWLSVSISALSMRRFRS